MDTIFLIGKIAGIILVISGFFHLVFGNKISLGKSWRDIYLKWTRITIVFLTVITFITVVILLVSHLIQVARV